MPELAQHAGTALQRPRLARTRRSARKKGKNKLSSTTGCKKKKHAFKVELTFIDNGVTTATKLSDTSTSKCSK